MRNFLLAAVLICCVPGLEAQRRGAGGAATLAISVADPEGKPIPDVLIVVEGPANRNARTEGGRIALENLPAGAYRLRFEKDGFLTLERELTARGGAPIDVKVTLKPALPPPPPPAPPAPPAKPIVKANAAIVDVPALIEKEFVGRGPSKSSRLSCGTDGESSILQLTAGMPPEEHADYDETFYVVAGEGTALVADTNQKLRAGVFLFIPRGMRHGLAPTGKNPLIVLTTRAGGC